MSLRRYALKACSSLLPEWPRPRRVSKSHVLLAVAHVAAVVVDLAMHQALYHAPGIRIREQGENQRENVSQLAVVIR